MPAPLGFHIHRLHILVSEDDHKWLREKQQQENDESISATFRNIIKLMRGLSLKNPDLNIRDILTQTVKEQKEQAHD